MSQKASLSHVEEILSLLDLVDHALRSKPRESEGSEGFPMRGILVTLGEIRQRVLVSAAPANAVSRLVGSGVTRQAAPGGNEAPDPPQAVPSRMAPAAVARAAAPPERGLAARIQMSPIVGARASSGTVREIELTPDSITGDSQ